MRPSKIVVMVRYYLPGFHSGGPVKSVANLIEHLGTNFDFRVFCLDRDKHDQFPYDCAKYETWVNCGKGQVMYVRPSLREHIKGLWAIRKIRPTAIYLNSCFDFKFSILPTLLWKAGFFGPAKAILAPRGEFSPGALKIKKTKKRLFMKAAKAFSFYRRVIWHSTGQIEMQEIMSHFGKGAAARTHVSENLPSFVLRQSIASSVEDSKADVFTATYLSRISPKKNLDYALRILSKVGFPIIFKIYGPVDDLTYWQNCLAMIEEMPSNVTVKYLGPVKPENVPDVLAAADVFFLPTRGENYGHSIVEALQVGTPVIISDQTPWRSLQAEGVGFDLPLEDEHSFVNALATYKFMKKDELAETRRRVLCFIAKRLKQDALIDRARALFMSAIGEVANQRT